MRVAGTLYQQLIDDIRWHGGPAYAWADVPPEPGADGGQPGGNIRNAFLYNPLRVALHAPALLASASMTRRSWAHASR